MSNNVDSEKEEFAADAIAAEQEALREEQLAPPSTSRSYSATELTVEVQRIAEEGKLEEEIALQVVLATFPHAKRRIANVVEDRKNLMREAFEVAREFIAVRGEERVKRGQRLIARLSGKETT